MTLDEDPAHLGLSMTNAIKELCLLVDDGALSLSLNDASMAAGNVYPRSQMSISFLIFSYIHPNDIRKFNYSITRYQKWL